MKINFYVVKASLAICQLDDLIRYDGSFVENKTFFLKDVKTQNFYSTYKIISANHPHKDKLQLAIDKYLTNEVKLLLRYKLIFKFAEISNSIDFSFKIYLKTAVEFDLFEGNLLKTNAVYYEINEQGLTIGPGYLSSENIPEVLREKMLKGLILVPTKKQLFEPIETAKAS